jgi:hypothetical protein
VESIVVAVCSLALAGLLLFVIKPFMLQCCTGLKLTLLQVRYTGSYDEAKKSVEKAWSTVNPTLKIDYKEVEEEIKFLQYRIWRHRTGSWFYSGNLPSPSLVWVC